MKQYLLVLKIGSLLAMIFAAGVWVGRNTVSPHAIATSGTHHGSAGNDELHSGRWALAFQRYIIALDLTAEQQALVAPYFKEADDMVVGLPRTSRERQRVIEVLHQRMEPHLNAQQKIELEAIRKESMKLLEKARAANGKRESRD